MTGDPPFEVPYYHVNPIAVKVLADKFSTMFIGAFGIVIIITPPPTAEEPEAPYTLKAIT
jgi:hypothetical protein